MGEFTVSAGGATLAGTEAGEGPPVVLLHGLTATRGYVIHGSRALQRAGRRVIAYDARGHGASSPADGYGYPALAADLGAVLDARGVEAAVLAGASMGAHTAVRFALDSPERVAGLVVITPAFDPDGELDTARWDALSSGLRAGGVDGFMAAYGTPPVPERWQETVMRIVRRRMAEHRDPGALADALAAVPRSRPFAAWEDLARIAAPTVVVASRDDADPEHPFAVGERYAAAIAGAHLQSEAPGESPLAWQGGRLARVIAAVA